MAPMESVDNRITQEVKDHLLEEKIRNIQEWICQLSISRGGGTTACQVIINSGNFVGSAEVKSFTSMRFPRLGLMSYMVFTWILMILICFPVSYQRSNFLEQ